MLIYKSLKYICSILFIVLLMCCNNKSNKQNHYSDNKSIVICNQSYIKNTISPIDTIVLDSIFSEILNSKLIEKRTYDIDSIMSYKFLKDAVSLDSVNYLSIKTSDNNIPKSRNNTYFHHPLVSVIKLNYSSEHKALQVYSVLEYDLANNILSGRILLKAGGICFVNGNNLYILTINNCRDIKDLILVKNILENKVLTNTKTRSILTVFCGGKVELNKLQSQ